SHKRFVQAARVIKATAHQVHVRISKTPYKATINKARLPRPFHRDRVVAQPVSKLPSRNVAGSTSCATSARTRAATRDRSRILVSADGDNRPYGDPWLAPSGSAARMRGQRPVAHHSRYRL